MEPKTILRVDDALKFVDLYLPHDTWKELVKRLGANRLTVVLRMLYEYTGDLKIEEKETERVE